VINLDRAGDRWVRFKDSMEENGIKDYHRFSAIDKRDPDIEKIFRENNVNTGKGLGMGIGACALSHKRVIEQIYGRGHSIAIIMEDDAKIVKPFPTKTYEFFNKYGHTLLSKDIIFLNSRINHAVNDRSKVVGLGADGYMVTKPGQLKLMKLLQSIHTHVDLMYVSHCNPHTFLSLFFRSKKYHNFWLNGWKLEENLVVEDARGHSYRTR